MRKVLFILSFVSLSAFSQGYTVIHTIGEIYDVNAKRYLAKGMKISEDAELRFDSEGARAAVLSSSRGRYVIQAQSTEASQSNIAYMLSSVINPVRGQLSTRAGGINNALDFSKHFEEGRIAMIGGSYEVKVSLEAYPMDDNRFFYAQYEYAGETINKKLSSESGTLQFDASSLYSIDDKPIDPTKTSGMKVFYYDAEKQESMQLSTVDFVMVNASELSDIMSNIDNPKSEEGINEVTQWINELYGKCNAEAVKTAMDSISE